MEEAQVVMAVPVDERLEEGRIKDLENEVDQCRLQLDACKRNLQQKESELALYGANTGVPSVKPQSVNKAKNTTTGWVKLSMVDSMPGENAKGVHKAISKKHKKWERDICEKYGYGAYVVAYSTVFFRNDTNNNVLDKAEYQPGHNAKPDLWLSPGVDIEKLKQFYGENRGKPDFDITGDDEDMEWIKVPDVTHKASIKKKKKKKKSKRKVKVPRYNPKSIKKTKIIKKLKELKELKTKKKKDTKRKNSYSKFDSYFT